MKIKIELIVEEAILKETLCQEFVKEVAYCRGYGQDYCPKNCTYAKEALRPEDYMVGMTGWREESE